MAGKKALKCYLDIESSVRDLFSAKFAKDRTKKPYLPR